MRGKLRKYIGMKAIDKRLARLEGRIKSLSLLTGNPATAESSRPLETLRYSDLMGRAAPLKQAPPPIPLTSSLCVQADFSRDVYRYWINELKMAPALHRKQWEFFFVVQALHERGFLAPGKSGLGFGVGQEALPALFTKLGCRIMATDLALEEASEQGWTASQEHAASLESLQKPEICDPATFARNVAFQTADMNAIPAAFDGQYDFCWSACCLEHLGSLQKGADFIENSLRTLKPGGLAVHTTEFNLSSNEQTAELPSLSIYRRRDIEALVARLERQGHRVANLNWDRGCGLVDGHVDLPPFVDGMPHLRLSLLGYDCTSIGLIIEKAAQA